jgi:RHS repeat-associated protein
LTLPATDESISTDFCAAMQFLTAGPNALQTGATSPPCSTIAAVHGKARSASGSPLPGLSVTVVGHPEWGKTVTRADGAFDLVVGAGVQVIQLAAPAFFPVHREVIAARGRYSHLDGDVVLVRADEKATALELPAGGLHTSTVREDDNGSRQVRVYIPPGTTAVAELPDGTTVALPKVTVRVTEYTVGPRGAEAMPAPLPESSAYTFAAEFSVDEARALGATGVRFSQPVATWVDNFLNAPLCTQVPQGRYDAIQTRWVAEPSSVVAQTAPGGLDVTGDGVADSEGFLLEGEAEALAAAFPPNKSLVRTLSTHFSPRDDNAPWQCDGTCTGSNRKVPQRAPDPLNTNTFPDGTQTVSRSSGGRRFTWFPDGTTVDESYASDTRFGSQSPFASGIETRLPSGLVRNDGFERKVTLDTTGSVLSLSRLQEGSSINRNSWLSVYTAADKTWRMTTPMGRVSTVTLDEKGRPVSWVTPGVAPVQVTYDARGRPVRMVQSRRSVGLTYGANGFADSLTDTLGRTTRLATDVTGQLESATRADSAVYAFGWDAKGNLTSLTPPGKPAHGFSYSKLDELLTYTPPTVTGVGNEAYVWTRDSTVSSVTHPDGTTTIVTRDRADRATRVEAPWATTTFDYSPMTGKLLSSTRAGQRLDWQYDGMLPLRETSSGIVGGSVSRKYNNDFRVIEVAVNDAGISYTYDNDGLLTSAGPVSMTRKPLTGQLESSTVANIVTTSTYDAYGALASLETRIGNASVFREVLTWDDIGRITRKDVTIQGTTAAWEYGYDGASRLSQAIKDGVIVGSWTYDANGNRALADGVTSTFDAQDRQLTAGATTFSHDTFGNRTHKTEGTQTTQYVYDGVGGLLSATLPDSTRFEYVIDSRGRRVGKKRNGALEKGWLYDGQLRVVAELDGAGAVIGRFVYGPLSHSPDVMVRGGVTYRYVHDLLGSVRLVVNTSNGQVAQRLDYDSWGVVTADSSPGFQPFGFAGGLFDFDTRLTRFGARDYDPSTGRWMSKDPIDFEAGDSNLYAYVWNTPISVIDPPGTNPPMAGAEGGAEVGVAVCGPPCAVIGAIVGAILGGAICGQMGCFDDPVIGPPLPAGGAEGGCAGPGDDAPSTATPMSSPGERNRTAKPSGTENPFKHMKPHPTDPKKVQTKDKDGKKVDKPKPQGFDDYWNSKK